MSGGLSRSVLAAALVAAKANDAEEQASLWHLRYLGDPVLAMRCDPLESPGDIPAGLLDAMRDVCLGRRREIPDTRKGLGLAANQVGAPVALCIVTIGKEFGVMINPRITACSAESRWVQEGCLSVPGFGVSKKRHNAVTVAFKSAKFEPIERKFTGLEAQCVQHEIDHLNGMMITDGLSRQLRRQAERAVEKARR